jgi:tetratricopeptide (TPR) repeat protein
MRKIWLVHCLGMLLLLFSAILPLKAQEAESFAPGDHVIVLPQTVPVRTQPTLSAPIVTELWGGMVSRVIAVETNEDDEVWLYLEQNAFAWVPAVQEGEPTLTHFSEVVLDEMLADATSVITGNISDADVIDAYLRRGTIHLSRREYPEAISDYSEAIKLAPKEGRYYEYRGKAYLDSTKYPEAVTDFEQALVFIQQNQQIELPGLHNRLGIAYYEQYELQRALLHYSIATEAAPDWGLVYNNIGNTFSRWEIYEDAFDNYAQAIATDPYFATGYHNRGLLYLKTNESALALDDFNRAIEIDPYYVDAYVQRGNWYSDVEADYFTAFENYDQAVAIDPDNSRAYAARGVSNRRLENFAEAFEDFNQALELDPLNFHARFSLSAMYSQVGRYDEAIESYTTLAEVGDEYDLSVLLYRSQIYIALDDYEQALKDLDELLVSKSELRNDFLSVTHLIRGSVYLHLERYNEAADDYSTAFSLWPEFLTDYNLYGTGYWIAPLRANTITDLQSQIDENSEASLYLQLGHTYMEFGQWQSALENYRCALDLEPNDELETFISQFESLIE